MKTLIFKCLFLFTFLLFTPDISTPLFAENMITSQTLGTVRSNFTGTAGLYFSISTSTPPIIDTLCRWGTIGNVTSHTVYLYDFSSTSPVLIDTTSVNISVFSGWNCGAITPYQTTNGGTYAIESAEINLGDTWYDEDTILNPKSGFTVLGSTVSAAIYHPSVTHGFIPVSMEYSYASAPPAGTSTIATTTATLGDIAFGQAIIITLLSLGLVGYTWNTMTAKKRQPWER